MKKFQRIFRYLGLYKAKLAAYAVFTILGTLFGILSLGMLAPFVSLIVNNDNNTKNLIKSKAVGKFISDYLSNVMLTHGKLYALAAVCVIIITAVLLKNICLYISNLLSAPVRSSIIMHLRNDMYVKAL